MIKIEKPRIELHSIDNQSSGWGGVRLVSHIVNDGQPIKEDIWFETTEEYGKYFCEEVCDAFVVAMLIPAVQTQQDIECDCISEKLLYNLNNEVSFILQSAWKGRRIQIKAKKTVDTIYEGKGIGSGCSLGVDSFASIFAHSSTYNTPNYSLTHLTNFNVGAFGSKNPALAMESWRNDLEKVKVFAGEYGLPLVIVNSNIGITNNNLSFDSVFIFRNASAVLALQKLFKRYFIGSGRTIDTVKTKGVKGDISYAESLLTPLLSTESLDIILSEGDKTRVEKTEFISNNVFVQQHLYVCWKEIFKNEWPKYWEEIKDVAEKNRNCTKCDKCMRTCLTLDLLGCLNDYREVFDLTQYQKTKSSYLKKIVVNRFDNSIYNDIYNLMIKKGVRIPKKIKMQAWFNHTKRQMINNVKTMLH